MASGGRRIGAGRPKGLGKYGETTVHANIDFLPILPIGTQERINIFIYSESLSEQYARRRK